MKLEVKNNTATLTTTTEELLQLFIVIATTRNQSLSQFTEELKDLISKEMIEKLHKT